MRSAARILPVKSLKDCVRLELPVEMVCPIEIGSRCLGTYLLLNWSMCIG